MKFINELKEELDTEKNTVLKLKNEVGSAVKYNRPIKKLISVVMVYTITKINMRIHDYSWKSTHRQFIECHN